MLRISTTIVVPKVGFSLCTFRTKKQKYSTCVPTLIENCLIYLSLLISTILLADTVSV